MGADFFLYKETNEKVTLSKKELENRIAAGGQVFDRQAGLYGIRKPSDLWI